MGKCARHRIWNHVVVRPSVVRPPVALRLAAQVWLCARAHKCPLPIGQREREKKITFFWRKKVPGGGESEQVVYFLTLDVKRLECLITVLFSWLRAVSRLDFRWTCMQGFDCRTFCAAVYCNALAGPFSILLENATEAGGRRKTEEEWRTLIALSIDSSKQTRMLQKVVQDGIQIPVPRTSTKKGASSDSPRKKRPAQYRQIDQPTKLTFLCVNAHLVTVVVFRNKKKNTCTRNPCCRKDSFSFCLFTASLERKESCMHCSSSLIPSSPKLAPPLHLWKE